VTGAIVFETGHFRSQPPVRRSSLGQLTRAPFAWSSNQAEWADRRIRSCGKRNVRCRSLHRRSRGDAHRVL